MDIIRKPKGTRDILPEDINKFRSVEKIASDTAECFGFKEIRMPTFEKTSLFKRGVGDTTDVVQKEMYSVSAKNPQGEKEPEDFTLRPEGTAGCVRAVIENGLLNGAMPLKLFYIINCFRHEKPQSGRFREFSQFGIELFGPSSSSADAEIITLAASMIERLGIKNAELRINSIGCQDCRKEYHKTLREYFSARIEKLCPTCLERLEKNPMRLLDCKSPVCSEAAKDAPIITDYLCNDCSEHFEELKSRLDSLKLDYKTDPKIVRGLDYYSRTVFEFSSAGIGAQSAICGGGRYDGLIPMLGGKPVPALGFAAGIDRLILAMQSQGADFIAASKCDVYIAPIGSEAEKKAAELIRNLRAEGFNAEHDLMGRGIKAQMKYADKLGASFTLVIGDNELTENKAKLKNMTSGEEAEIPLDGGFLNGFSDVFVADMFKG